MLSSASSQYLRTVAIFFCDPSIFSYLYYACEVLSVIDLSSVTAISFRQRPALGSLFIRHQHDIGAEQNFSTCFSFLLLLLRVYRFHTLHYYLPVATLISLDGEAY